MATQTSLLPIQPKGTSAGMTHFIVLIFSGNDDIVATESLRAANAQDAQRMAELVLQTRGSAGAGYQLWQNGIRIHSSGFAHRPAETPLAALFRFPARAG